MFEMFKKPDQETETETLNEAQNENTEETTKQTEYINPENPEPEPCQITKTDNLAQLEELSKEEQSPAGRKSATDKHGSEPLAESRRRNRSQETTNRRIKTRNPRTAKEMR
jgi:hypothetical protein